MEWSKTNPSKVLKCRPRRCIAKKRWFPSSSRKRPPSSFTPVPETWSFQSLVQFNLQTLTWVLGPIQPRIEGFVSSSLIAEITSLGSCRSDWDAMRLLMIPQHWSQLVQDGKQKQSLFSRADPAKTSCHVGTQLTMFWNRCQSSYPAMCVWLLRKWHSATHRR